MKTVVMLFATAFLTSAVAGYSIGRTGSDETEAAKVFLDHTHLQERDGEVSLTFSCGAESKFRWNVDQKELVALSREALVPQSTDAKAFTKEFATYFIGGSATTASASGIAAVVGGLKSEKSRNMLVAVVGAVSGFSIGFGLAQLGEPPCDSPAVMSVAQKDAIWRNLITYEFMFQSNQLISASIKYHDQIEKDREVGTKVAKGLRAAKSSDTSSAGFVAVMTANEALALLVEDTSKAR